MRTLAFTVLCLAACAPPTLAPSEDTPPAGLSRAVENGSFLSAVVAGYQGWFGTDREPGNRWSHWSPVRPEPGKVTFELYPDVREYAPEALADTGLGRLGNGQPAQLYSSQHDSVVETHFRWMEEHGIDGVALQRFVVGLNEVELGKKVRQAAERHGRIFYVEYDLSGSDPATWVRRVEDDWERSIEPNLVGSSRYARQGNRPVVVLWGIGFGDRGDTVEQGREIIDWFHARGVFVGGGTPLYWRTGEGVKPGYLDVYSRLDLIMPWAVGTIGHEGDIAAHFSDRVPQDLEWARARGIAYQRVIFPGFAWSNWNGPPRNGISRNSGRFFWAQAYETARLGSGAFIAMFDEYDEGTAIAKAAEDASMIPVDQYFLTLDADGDHLSSDFYLRLAGAATRMLHGEAPLERTIPIPFVPGGPPPPAPGQLLAPGVSLGPDESRASGRFTLVHQGDGNVVLYEQGGIVRWASRTNGNATRTLEMQGDGNLVLYAPDGAPVWSTGTQDNPGARLRVEEPGELVIVDAQGQRLWNSGTN